MACQDPSTQCHTCDAHEPTSQSAADPKPLAKGEGVGAYYQFVFAQPSMPQGARLRPGIKLLTCSRDRRPLSVESMGIYPIRCEKTDVSVWWLRHSLCGDVGCIEMSGDHLTVWVPLTCATCQGQA